MKVGANGDYPSRFRGGIFDLFSNLWYNKNEKHFKNEIEAIYTLSFEYNNFWGAPSDVEVYIPPHNPPPPNFILV